MRGSCRRRSRPAARAASWWAAALLLLALMAASALVACGGSGSSGGSSSGDAASAGQGGPDDSFMKAWPKAQDAMTAVAGDAVLVASGSNGLALADVPDSWGFSYFSPEKGSVYSVDVEHGKAGTPREMGAVKKGVTVKTAMDVAAIKVGAGEAVVKARAFGEQSGEVPKNVVVGGVFAEFPNSAAAGYEAGVWTIAFASGTDLADAQTYEVDMMTGAVSKVKSK